MDSATSTRREYAPGDEILGARLIERIGSGAERAVWTARDRDGRALAVKIFSPESEESAATFRRGLGALERAASQADGARLLPLHGVSLDQIAYSSDYYENGNAGGIPALHWDVARIVDFFALVCRAVAVLHGLGMAHRALKPSNVLIDDDLEPILADASMPALRDPSVPLSRTDAIYLAPEELDGTSNGAPTADVFGLGRLLWFLLLGADPEEPYEAFAELSSLQKSPEGLVRIVRKATALAPSARYGSVEELEADLRRYQKPELVGLPGTAPLARQEPGGVVAPVPRVAWSLRPAAQTGERLIGKVALGAVVVAGALLFLTPEPTPTAAKVFGVVATVGLALGTLLLRPYEARPLLWRLAAFGGAAALLFALEPDRLVLVRWKLTLAQGSAEARPRVARLLARWGARDLSGAELAKGDFRRADLGRADLRNANLERANFRNANLSEANFRGASVRGADLRGADLAASSAPEAEGFTASHCDRSTAMPDRWRCLDGHPAPHGQ